MKKHPKLILTLVVIVVIVAGGLLWWLLAGSDKAEQTKDYAAAQKAYQATVTSYGAYEKAFNTYSDGDYASTANKDAYKQAQEDYQAKVSSLKAAIDKLDDRSVSADYQKFADQSQAFVDYADGYAEDYQTAQDVLKSECLKLAVPVSTSGSDILATYGKQAALCQTDLVVLKGSSNAGLASFGKAVEQTLQDRRSALTTAQQKVQAGDTAGIQEAITKFMTVESPDLTKSMAEARQKLTVVKSLEKLGDTLGQKTADAQK